MTEVSRTTTDKTYPARVIRVLDDRTIVINRGKVHEVQAGRRFLVYVLSDEELIDPETNESLGYLEIVRGIGVVTHVQEKMATLHSDRKVGRRIVRRSPGLSVFGSIEEEVTPESDTLPFDGVADGDFVKPV